jgi:beta-fructofuranosidase
MRELVQDADGTLGTRFVPEMIPPGTPPVALKFPANPTRLEAGQERRQILIDQIPNDVRLTLTLVPEGPVKAFGLRLRTSDGKTDGTELRFERGTAGFSARTSSGGPNGKGPAIQGLENPDRATTLDIVCTHDLVDVEINGRHTLINRYWNPKGDRLGIWVEGGTLTVKDATIRNLLEHTPPGALRPPEMTRAGNASPQNTPVVR